MLFHHHHHFLGLFGLPFLLLSFLPTIIAALRHSRHVVGIALLNFFLGWTVIGWVIALILALTSEPRFWVPYSPYGQPQYRRRW